MKFEVGDSVAAYGQSQANSLSARCFNGGLRATGVVVAVFDDRVNVDLRCGCTAHTFHMKQCRKLVKKSRRRIWVWKSVFGLVPPLESNMAYRTTKPHDSDIARGWLEFVEVKRVIK